MVTVVGDGGAEPQQTSPPVDRVGRREERPTFVLRDTQQCSEGSRVYDFRPVSPVGVQTAFSCRAPVSAEQVRDQLDL